ncbi:MAG: hypothetical protein F6J93_10155 [Oscillatoria sp. SIO1A7]|nr:hypothetical protein [Oscillatoria sp. SIO1A7]
MTLENFVAKNIDFDPAIVVKDKDDRPMMFVDVRSYRTFSSEDLTIHHLEDYQQVPFLMFVNLKQIRIYQSGNYQPAMTLRTEDILSFYAPNSQEYQVIFQDYLVSLVDGWLSDLSYQWKSYNPPYKTQINEIGLTFLLEKGVGFVERIWEWD